MKYLKLSDHVKYIRETLVALRSLALSRTFKSVAAILMIVLGFALLFFPSMFTLVIFMAFCLLYLMFGFGCTLFMIDYIKNVIKSDFLVFVLHIIIMILWPLFLIFAYGVTTYHKLA